MNDPILLLRDGQFVDCNTATLRLLGYHSKAEFLNRRPSDISPAVQPDGRSSEDKAAELIATALREGYHRFEWIHARADGSAIPVEVTLTPITVAGELILHTLWRDITERKRAEEALAEYSRDLEALNRELAASNAHLAAAHQELERLAMRDTLTGAWNRRYLGEITQQEILRMERYGHPVSLIFIDLDHFKQINDTHGHAAGDAVLSAFCDVARQCMRATDMLGRWGGEEFVIAMPNSGLMIASLLAERIRTAMMAHQFPLVGSVTASFGVAECRAGETWECWLARADAALYSAKQAGRNRVIADASDWHETDQAELLDLAFLRLVWRDAYESGHAEIDRQHRNLFDHANTLLTAVIGDRPKGEILPLIKILQADLLTHFADEEALLRTTRYAETDHHVAVHQALVERAQDLAANFQADALALGDLFNFLAYDVVAKHMLSEDRKFFPHLAPLAEAAN